MDLNRNVIFIENDDELSRACRRIYDAKNKLKNYSTRTSGDGRVNGKSSGSSSTKKENSANTNEKEGGNKKNRDNQTLVIGVDIETSFGYGGIYPNEGLDPYTSKIVMVQFGTLEMQYVVDARKITNWTPFKYLMEDEEIKKVGHNLKFEYKFFKHHLNCIMENYHDTMICEQILFCGKRKMLFSLKEVCKRRLSYDPDKTVRGNFLRIKNRAFTKQEIEYGADDVILPLLIKKQQNVDIIKANLYACVRLEMQFLAVLGDMELNGMTFSKENWIKIYEENNSKRSYFKEKLDEYVLDNEPLGSKFTTAQYDLFSDNSSPITVNINWSSPAQVVDYFKHLGICPAMKSKFTGKYSYTVDATALSLKIRDIKDEKKKELAKTYLDFKANEKNCTTYGLDFLKHVNPITGKIHSNYRQILNTGRISSSNPNLQNIPAGIHRTCFVAPSQGTIINADYSGQENIVLANKSMEPGLLAFYESGESDFHSYVARLLWPKELGKFSLKEIKQYHPGLRQRAKAAGFAIAYGGNGHTIAKNLGLPDHVGEETYNAYFKAFPELKNYFKKVHKQALRDKYILIDNITRRRSWLHVDDWNDTKSISKAKRDAQNFSIQGEAASITKLAAILFRKKFYRTLSAEDIRISNIVHDEINLEINTNSTPLIDFYKKELEECMEKAGKVWCKTVPLKAEAVASKYWTH